MSPFTASLRYNLAPPLSSERVPTRGVGSLSSYRASLEALMRPLFIRSSEPVSDTAWLNMFANRINSWFAASDDLLVPGSPHFFQLAQFKALVMELSMNEYSVALSCLKQVRAANVLDLTTDELAFFTSDRLWLASDRRLAESCVKSACAGSLDVIGLPRFAVPAEFVAAVIAEFVHPVNTLSACSFMDGVETSGNIVRGVDRPLSARELFAMVLEIRSGDSSVVDGVVRKAKRLIPRVDPLGSVGE